MDGLADPTGGMPAIQPTRRAAIGVGPAGLRMVIAGYIDGLLDTIAAAEAIAPLGHSLAETGSLETDSLAVIEAGVAAMADEAICLGAAPPEVAISSAFSRADDLNALEDAIIRGGGRTSRVLEPGDEANLTYVGAMAGDPRAPALVVSIGDHSTELMGGAAHLHWVSSAPCGSLSMTEQFLVGATADLDDLEAMIASAREVFEPIAAEHPVTAVVGVGRLAATVAMLGGSPRISRRRRAISSRRSSSALAAHAKSRSSGQKPVTAAASTRASSMATSNSSKRSSVPGLNTRWFSITSSD